jgi:hypothetical protein
MSCVDRRANIAGRPLEPRSRGVPGTRAGSTQGRGVGVLAGAGAALALIVLLVMQSEASAGIFGAKADTVTVTTTVVMSSASTSTTTASSVGSCLLPLEASATTAGYAMGTLVTYAPGEQVYYPEFQCPQPVENRTFEYQAITSSFKVPTNEYQLALTAVSNPEFTSLENGTEYVYSQPGFWSYSTFGNSQWELSPTGYYYDVVFYHYSNSTHDWCGPNTPRPTVLSGIVASFFAPFGSNWELLDPSIQMMSQNDVGSNNYCVIA